MSESTTVVVMRVLAFTGRADGFASWSCSMSCPLGAFLLEPQGLMPTLKLEIPLLPHLGSACFTFPSVLPGGSLTPGNLSVLQLVNPFNHAVQCGGPVSSPRPSVSPSLYNMSRHSCTLAVCDNSPPCLAYVLYLTVHSPMLGSGPGTGWG
jgi:hypothetical protein